MPSRASRPSGPTKILLVEDEDAHAELVRRAFEDEPDYRISVARSLAAARELIQREQPQLILSDLLLPDGRGIDLLESPGQHPLILLTSHGDESVAVEAIKAGALDYVVKSPQVFSSMPDIVRRGLREWMLILDRRRAEAEVQETVRALRELHRITSEARDFDGKLPAVLSWGSKRLGLSIALLARCGGEHVELRAVVGGGGRLVPGATLPKQSSILATVIERREPLLVEDAEAGDPLAARAFAGVPISVGEQTYGALCFADPAPRTASFSSTDVELLKLLAQWVGGELWRQQTHDALRATERKFQQSQRLETIARLASGVAHDYNNLLMGIGGCVDFALKKIEASSPARVYLEEAQRAAKRGSTLTRQLLAFSRKRTNEPTNVDVSAVIASTEKMMRSLMGEEVELTFDLVPTEWRVRAEVGQLEQLIMNLVVNARDAMPSGGELVVRTAEVTLDGANLPAEHPLTGGPYVTLVVQDTGIGMDEATLAQIFEPFFTTKGADRGTGLGLSTVKGIVEAIGGHIDVESAPNQGTSFTVYLPCSPPEPEKQPAVSEHTPAAATGGTVLLVEDDPLVRSTVQGYLQEAGYQVLSAADASGAVALARNHASRLDLILTDVMLPGGGGSGLVREVLALRPSIKALCMSAHPHDLLVQWERVSPDTKVLQKPFDEATLLSHVRRALTEDA